MSQCTYKEQVLDHKSFKTKMKFEELNQLDRIEYFLISKKINDENKSSFIFKTINYFMIFFVLSFLFVFIAYNNSNIALVKNIISLSFGFFEYFIYLFVFSVIVDVLLFYTRRSGMKKLNKRFGLGEK